jgi:hypothetical protein
MSTALALSPTSLSAPVMAGTAKHSADDDFTFDDLISIVNPLQHIPVVSTIYRSLTGETIKPFERILGDTLYGGVWGCVSAVANVVYQDVTGKDFGQTVLDFAKDEILGNDDDAQTATASNAAPDSSSTTNTTAAATAASINSSASTATAQPASLPAPAPTPAPSVANGPPKTLQTPVPSTSPSDAATIALMHAMSSKGIDPTLSQRALSAYKKSLTPPLPQPAVPTS